MFAARPILGSLALALATLDGCNHSSIPQTFSNQYFSVAYPSGWKAIPTPKMDGVFLQPASWTDSGSAPITVLVPDPSGTQQFDALRRGFLERWEKTTGAVSTPSRMSMGGWEFASRSVRDNRVSPPVACRQVVVVGYSCVYVVRVRDDSRLSGNEVRSVLDSLRMTR